MFRERNGFKYKKYFEGFRDNPEEEKKHFPYNIYFVFGKTIFFFVFEKIIKNNKKTKCYGKIKYFVFFIKK